MSTRSPMNKRTQAQLQGERAGMTRKSASSAKPARPAAASVRVVASSGKARRAEMERGEDLSNLTKAEKKARRQEQRMREDRVYAVANELMRQDADYPKHRRVWWGMLGVGVVALVIVWVMLFAQSQNGQPTDVMQTQQLVIMGISYAAIIGGFIFDFVKIRPIRKAARAKAEGMSEKQLAATLDKMAAEEDERKAAREAKKTARKSK